METTLSPALAWAAQATDNGGQQSLFPPELLLMMVAIGGLFYFLILRPQRREQHDRQQMIDQLGKGDKVVTAGGFHGTVEAVDKEKGEVTLAIAPKVNVRINRASIASVVSKKGKKGGEEPAAKS